MADLGLNTSFSIYQDDKKILEAKDIITDQFKKLLTWLLYRRISVPDVQRFRNYHEYITEKFLFAFGTGTTPATGTETNLEKPVSLYYDEQLARTVLYWRMPKSSKNLWGMYWRPMVYEDDYVIRLYCDIPGGVFTKAGHQDDITEIGIFVGVPLGWISYKALVFRWWDQDYQYVDYVWAVDEANNLGIINRFVIKTYYGTTSYVYKQYYTYTITVNYPYSSNYTYKQIPYVVFYGGYSQFAYFSEIYVNVLMAKIVLDTPLHFEPGYTYSFRYTIYKR